MSWYRTGTVAVTNGNTVVTGTGTLFAANARTGDAFIGPDGRTYEVTNIPTESTISIYPGYLGSTASGQSYAIAPMQGYVKASADRLREAVDNYAGTLESIQPWATADTPAEARTDLGLGTIATQNAAAVTITGGAVSGLSSLISSAGIKLGNSAVSDSATLDWYEEGTFTPVVSGSTSAGSGTYSNQIGTFTRNGNRVDFNILLAWSAHSGSGNLTVGGMPFTSASAGPSVFSVSFDGLTVGTGKQLTPHMGINASSFVFFVCDLAGGAISTLPMDSSVSSLRVTGAYACQ